MTSSLDFQRGALHSNLAALSQFGTGDPVTESALQIRRRPALMLLPLRHVPDTRITHPGCCGHISPLPLLAKTLRLLQGLTGVHCPTRPQAASERAHAAFTWALAPEARRRACSFALTITHLTDALVSATEAHVTAAQLQLTVPEHGYANLHARWTLLAILLLGVWGHFLLTGHFHLIWSSGLNFPGLQDAAHNSPSLGMGV